MKMGSKYHMIGVLIIVEGNLDTKTQTFKGQDHINVEAEICKPRNAKDRWQPPEARKEAENGFSLRVSRGTNPTRTLILDFYLYAS